MPTELTGASAKPPQEEAPAFSDQWDSRPAKQSVTTPRSPRRGPSGVKLLGWLLIPAILVGAGGWVAWRRAKANRYETACREAHSARDWEQVERLATRWLEFQPDRALPRIYLSDVAQERLDHAGAAEILAGVSDDDPQSLAALELLTRLQFGEVNRAADGAETCLRMLAINPKYKEARQRLIYYYAMTVQRRLLIEQIYEAVRLGIDTPEDYVYLMTADSLSFSNGAEQNTLWMRGDAENPVFKIARVLFMVRTGVVGNIEREGDESNPAKVLADRENAASENSPDQAPGSAPEGGDGKRSPRFDESSVHEVIMKELLEQYPEHLELRSYFIETGIARGDVAEVARLLNEAPPAAAEDNRYWRYRGWLLTDQEKLPEAEQAYRQALKLHRYDYVAYHGLGEVLRLTRREQEMAVMEDLSVRGQAIKRDLLQLPTARSVSGDLLVRLAEFARDCGDEWASQRLFERINKAAAPSNGGLFD